MNELRIRDPKTLAKAKNHYANPTDPSWREFFTDPNMHTVAAFCLIGFLLTLDLMLLFPDLGELIAQYNQF